MVQELGRAASRVSPPCQGAIAEAMDGDEIVVAPGTYFESINLGGLSITLRSSDGPDPTIIDAQGSPEASRGGVMLVLEWLGVGAGRKSNGECRLSTPA